MAEKNMSTDHKKPVFEDIKGVVEEVEEGQEVDNITDIESLCLNCRENGRTRMLFTKIPFFREVVVMSFECSHCEWKNNELQPASRIQEKGIRFRLQVKNVRDLSRQVVKTEFAEISIPELDFNVTKQNGLITTIEGMIDRAVEGLQSTIPRIRDDPESIVKISNFINNLIELKSLERGFTFVLDDPTGNSFIENFNAPEPDPLLSIQSYERTLEQEKLIGIVADDAVNQMGSIQEEDTLDVDPSELMKGEVLEFPTNCHECSAPCMTRMKITDIPHFKQVIIMATSCDVCGHKTNEVKSGCGMEEKGVKITMKIKSPEDMTLDVVKSGHCSVFIPELEFELNSSGSGRYTTVEGLITHIRDQLKESNPFRFGDSVEIGAKKKLEDILERLDNMIGLTVILDDPTGNTYIENADEVVHYERTWEQNEELGINDMKTESYETDS